MTLPTKTQVMAWEPGMLAAVAAEAAKLRDAIDTEADSMNRTIHGLDWSGAAFEAAAGRADREKSQQRAVATAYDDLSTALQGAENDTGWLIGEIQRIVHNLPHGWSVADDFAITYHDAADKDAAKNDTVSLQSLAAQLGQAMDKWAPKISDAVGAISSMAPVTAEKHTTNPADQFTAQQAQADLQAVRNGTADAATLARLQAATSLTASEKDDLANGRSVSLAQFDYLQALSQGMNGMSGEDIADLGNKLHGNGHDAVQAAIANDLRLISDPQVHSAGLDGQPGNLVGGMNKLPDVIRHDLTSKPDDLMSYNGLNALGTLMSKGDTGIQGSDINRAMIKQGAELAKFSDAHVYLKDGPLANTADRFLGDAAGDHAAVRDAIIANPNSSAPDARDAANRMNVTCGNGGKYYGNQHVVEILQHPWSKDQHGAENMFKWIGQDASLPKGSFANNEAGQTAYGLAAILADPNNQHALNSPDNPLGGHNPALTRTLANSMSPYLGNFAGVTDTNGINLLNSSPVDSSGHPLASPFTETNGFTNMFSVLDSDPEAARTLNSAGIQWHDSMEYARGLDPSNSHVLHQNIDRLDTAMRDGLTNQINSHAAERSFQASQEYADKGVFADGVTSVVQTAAAIGGGPVSGPVVGGIAATVDSYVKADVIPNPADPAHPLPDDKVSSQLSSIRDSIQSNDVRDEYLQVQGYVQRDPSAAQYFDQPGQGSLLDWHNIATPDASGVNAWNRAYSEFSHDVNPKLPTEAFTLPDHADSHITEPDIEPRGNQKPPGATK